MERVVPLTLVGNVGPAQAIALSLFIIVLASTGIGTMLPLGLYHLGFDPAHAGPSIQVRYATHRHRARARVPRARGGTTVHGSPPEQEQV